MFKTPAPDPTDTQLEHDLMAALELCFAAPNNELSPSDALDQCTGNDENRRKAAFDMFVRAIKECGWPQYGWPEAIRTHWHDVFAVAIFRARGDRKAEPGSIRTGEKGNIHGTLD